MQIGLLAQYMLLAALLVWSVLYLGARQFPGLVSGLRRWAALRLLAHSTGPRMQAWVRRLAPAPVQGCVGAGSTCGGCAAARR